MIITLDKYNYSLFLNKVFLKSITDVVNDRSSHNSSATRSGGLGIFLLIFLFPILLHKWICDIRFLNYCTIIYFDICWSL